MYFITHYHSNTRISVFYTHVFRYITMSAIDMFQKITFFITVVLLEKVNWEIVQY